MLAGDRRSLPQFKYTGKSLCRGVKRKLQFWDALVLASMVSTYWTIIVFITRFARFTGLQYGVAVIERGEAFF